MTLPTCDQCNDAASAVLKTGPEAEIRFIFEGDTRDKTHLAHLDGLSLQDQQEVFKHWEEDMTYYIRGRCKSCPKHRTRKVRICVQYKRRLQANMEHRWKDQQDVQKQVRETLSRCFAKIGKPMPDLMPGAAI